jgi:hypothetical protein
MRGPRADPVDGAEALGAVPAGKVVVVAPLAVRAAAMFLVHQLVAQAGQRREPLSQADLVQKLFGN